MGVHSAGIMPLSPILKNDVKLFDEMIATNRRSTFLVLAQAAQHVANNGRIMALTSSVVAKSTPTYGAYIASKTRSGTRACWTENQIASVFLKAFPDMKIMVHEIVGSPGRAGVRASIIGTHLGEVMGVLPTGQPVEIALHKFHHLE